VIVKPMQSLVQRPRIWLKITIAWTLSLIFPLPQLFIFVHPRRICGSRGYTAPWQRKVYFTYTTIYILVIPMLIMLYCYTKIIRVVWVRAEHETRRRSSCLMPRPTETAHRTRMADRTSDTSREMCPSNENSDTGCGCDRVVKTSCSRPSKTVRWSRKVMESHRMIECASEQKGNTREDLNASSPRMSIRRGLITASKRRALVMTLTVVISFLVCHTPYFLLTLVRIYSDYQLKLERAMFLSEVLVMVHSTLNPLLYGLFTLRQYHLKHIMSLLTCSTHPTHQQHTQHLRQYSHDRTKLLSNVRSKLSSINSSGATTTTTFVSNRKSTHTDPLLRHNKPGRTKHLSTDDSSRTSLSSTKCPLSTAQCTDQMKPCCQTLDWDVCSDKGTKCLTDKQLTLLQNTHWSDVGPLVVRPPDRLPPHSCINLSAVLQSNGTLQPSGASCLPSSHRSGYCPRDVSVSCQNIGDNVLPNMNPVTRPNKMEETTVEGFNRD
ncbi:unnamed protein product, partial [Candidula unifasciata]